MILDPHAANPAFAGGQMPAVDLEETIAWVRDRLAATEPWTLISARRKLGKALFEVEEGGRRMIGILSNSDRAATAYRALHTLWEAGMRPPATHTVVRPVAHLVERNLLLLEKSEGRLLWDCIREDRESALENTERAAQWLATLHGLSVDAPAWPEDRARLDKWTSELMNALPGEAIRIERMRAAMAEEIGAPAGDLVPSHGDYQPHNIFIAEDGRVTVIDADKFGRRERAFDVAYFLAQTGAMGYQSRPSFAWTLPHRQRFFDAYQAYAGVELPLERIGVYMAATLLQSLHYELSVYKTGRIEIAGTFLSLAEGCLYENDILLPAKSALPA
jgi:aminoglycoside phosphotransferase (APT) family kinase protein